MLRLCIRNCYQNNLLFSPVSQHTTSQWSSALNNVIFRNYAVKLSEVDPNLVYYGPLTPQIKAVKVFSLTSSIAGLLAQPIMIKEAASIGSTSLIVAICSVVGFFTFVTPVLLHLVTKKYVTQIAYDSATSTYKATTINFFLARKQVSSDITNSVNNIWD